MNFEIWRELIPKFHFRDVVVLPWTTELDHYGWIFLMGVLVTVTCALVGNYLLLRRAALVGDAVSHSLLPGIVIAFLLTGRRDSWLLYVGAIIAGVFTTLLIEFIQSKTRVKSDAAMGISFTTLFAIGVILISVFADQVDLDVDCVLYGEIGFISLYPLVEWWGISLAPQPVLHMAGVLLGVLLLIIVFYKELLVTSFDSHGASSLGISTRAFHYGLMSCLSVVVVSAFESVGAILVVAMLILPGSTASLCTKRLPSRLVWSIVFAVISAIGGVHLGVWLNCSLAGAMVMASSLLFCAIWWGSWLLKKK